MDSKLTYLKKIEKKLEKINLDIDKNQWGKLAEQFLEIKDIKNKIDAKNPNKKESSQELIDQQKTIRSKIDSLEKKIIKWKEDQKEKIEKLKKKENHLNGYKKQPNRPYYIDKSE